MSFGDWFKRLFSPSRTDAPIDVANETNDETTIDEARMAAGGGANMVAGDAAGFQADSVVEGERSDEEPPSGPAS